MGARRRIHRHLRGWRVSAEILPAEAANRFETGELCGSVFWALLSQRLHLLDPEQEKYVTEIEKSIYNVGIANQVDHARHYVPRRLTGRKGDVASGPLR